MSRSVTVAVAYIMSTTNLSWKEALKVVRVGRSIANPNVGFQQQLKDFESSRLQEVNDKIETSASCATNVDFAYSYFHVGASQIERTIPQSRPVGGRRRDMPIHPEEL